MEAAEILPMISALGDQTFVAQFGVLMTISGNEMQHHF